MRFSSTLLFAAAANALPRNFLPHMGAAMAVEASDEKKPLTTRANKIIPVVVGGPQVIFVPNSVRAEVGDIIQFQFSNGNHTVTQSAQDQGCQPLQKTNANAIHSGHIPFSDGQTTVGTFNMPVTNTDPMFLYCATGPHCQLGQVMIVNPANDQQLVDYSKISAQAADNVDGGAVSGGHIPLAQAAFVPAPPEDGAAPPPPPPAGGAATTPAAATPAATTPAATGTAAAGGNVVTQTSGTTTTTITVTKDGAAAATSASTTAAAVESPTGAAATTLVTTTAPAA